MSLDSFKCAKTLKVGSKSYRYYSLKAAEKNGLKGIARLPYSLKVLLENLLRHEDGRSVTRADLEYERNGERYTFLKWGQGAFDNFRVVPPGTGICHQVNLEYLARTVWTKKEEVKGKEITTAYPDTLVGTDSHTTMINGLAVLG